MEATRLLKLSYKGFAIKTTWIQEKNEDKKEVEMVRQEGVEPPRLSAPEPKSGVSTNSTTSA